MVYKLSVLEMYNLLMHNYCASAIATIQALLPTLYWGTREPMGLELENATVYEFTMCGSCTSNYSVLF